MNRVKGQFPRIVYYVYGFFVLWEWLRPLEVVTDTGNITIFFYFIALCYILAYLSPPFYVSLIVKFLFIAYFIHAVFFEGLFLEWEWIIVLIQEVKINIGYMIQANWWDLTAAFRTILFFVLLGLLAYLMEYWIISLKKILLFLVITITYLGILDAFTLYDTDFAVIRMMMFGFLVLGLLQFERLKEQESILVTKKIWIKWLVPLLILTLTIPMFGYVAPKAAPIWPDPMPFLTGYGNRHMYENINGINGMKRIGYGTNDSRLGGSFIGDDTVVFTAVTTMREYWRVETKDVYTGRGWEASDIDIWSVTEGEDVFVPMVETGVETIPSEAKITIELGYPHIVYPVELAGVKSDLPIEYKVNTNTEKVMTERNGNPYSLESYEILYNDPLYIFEDLRNSDHTVSEYILERYTQLPINLPARVQELATEIIKPFSNQYDQVKAVEGYFRRNGFVYDTVDVAVPGINDDYVDQFLFETMKGYCDNFSTSMVVLLRSVGIPARWVKGYTGGEYVKTLENNTRLYEVQNANAHSWVEVYFAGSGWVPFEPTMGFSNPYTFSSNQETEESVLPIPELDQELLDSSEEDLLGEENEGEIKNSNHSWSWSVTFSDIVKGTGVVFLLAIMLYFTRRRWYPSYLLRRYGNFKNSISYEKAYFALIHALKGYGLKKKDSQTLREYASYVDSYFYTKDMRKLTLKLEGIQHKRDRELDQKEIDTLRQLWENLIKRVSS